MIESGTLSIKQNKTKQKSLSENLKMVSKTKLIKSNTCKIKLN